MAADARLDLRLDPKDKARIERAAGLRGMPLSVFVRDAVMREADNVMTAELTATLSAKESKRFLQVVDQPFAPNAKLKKALSRLTRE
jgi:uncharacterized protein (DUF1778 family)